MEQEEREKAEMWGGRREWKQDRRETEKELDEKTNGSLTDY